MSSNTNLELNGKLSDFSLAELLIEAAHADLSGSFRLAHEAQKIAVYLEKGAVVYAASNMRSHRFAECAASSGLVLKTDLAALATINDAEIGKRLLADEKINAAGLRELQSRQTATILRTALSWNTGEWTFSPLVRVREDLRVTVNLPPLLAEAARSLPEESVFRGLRFDTESFALQSVFPEDVSLTSEEAFLLSRIEGVMQFDNLKIVSGLSDTTLLRTLFVLWLAGFLHRYNWRGAFAEDKLMKIQSAKLTLAAPPQASPEPEKPATPVVLPVAPPEVVEEDSAAKEKRELEEFLARMKKAVTHYQVLNIANSAEESEIKKAYFSLAKRFHPDKFHQTGGETLALLQDAFARITQAYETLKDKKLRELYDFKMSKSSSMNDNQLSADSCYERGKKALEAKNNNEAIMQLARAVQLQPENSLFHLAYAQALSTTTKYRHQAENEFAAALKIEPNNPAFHLRFSEFYLAQGLSKRAEAHLKRALSLQSNNARARQLLDGLTANKSKV